MQIKLRNTSQYQQIILYPYLTHNQNEDQSNEAVTFQGIEFLQRDPGLRLQTWQYPPDQRGSVWRAYLKLGPMQPHLQNYEP